MPTSQRPDRCPLWPKAEPVAPTDTLSRTIFTQPNPPRPPVIPNLKVTKGYFEQGQGGHALRTTCCPSSQRLEPPQFPVRFMNPAYPEPAIGGRRVKLLDSTGRCNELAESFSRRFIV
jgi:hypothetical protein